MKYTAACGSQRGGKGNLLTLTQFTYTKLDVEVNRKTAVLGSNPLNYNTGTVL